MRQRKEYEIREQAQHDRNSAAPVGVMATIVMVRQCAIVARSHKADGKGWTNVKVQHQGHAHIVSTAIRSPRPARGPAEVGGKPRFRTSLSVDPQPASINPTINISTVFTLSFPC